MADISEKFLELVELSRRLANDLETLTGWRVGAHVVDCREQGDLSAGETWINYIKSRNLKLKTNDHDTFARLSRMHPRVQADWLGGRRCLLEVFGVLEKTGADLADAHLSMTHASGFALALGAVRPHGGSSSHALTGIGIDLEASPRMVHPDLPKRVLVASETQLGLKFLDLWVIKEAAFKSFPQNTLVHVTDFVVLDYDAAMGGGAVTCAKEMGSRLFYRLFHSPSWTVAVAAPLL